MSGDSKDPNPYWVVSHEKPQANYRSAQSPMALNGFEKFCAVLAFALAIALMILGVMGLFLGCSANFTLPPILGVAPALVAWGIIRPIMKSWNG